MWMSSIDRDEFIAIAQGESLKNQPLRVVESLDGATKAAGDDRVITSATGRKRSKKTEKRPKTGDSGPKARKNPSIQTHK